MKKLIITITIFVVVGVVGFSYVLNAAGSNDSVSDNLVVENDDKNTLSEESEVFEDGDYSIEEMLTYAMLDEYKARAEYEKIIEVYGEVRPFTNIIKAEEAHIAMLEPLFEKYNVELPDSDVSDQIVIPDSIEEALEIGIKAEIYNISIYETFLSKDLPEDIESAFIYLRDGSKNHLAAFERGTQRGNNN